MDVLVSLGTNTAYIYSVLNVVLKWVKASQGSEFDGPDYFETFLRCMQKAKLAR